jgi:cysteine desulfurase
VSSAGSLVGMSVYLDHAASTPMHSEAVTAMEPWYSRNYGNPSGAHLGARTARRAIDEARDTMAEVLGAEPGEVVFTSGGTEADNQAVFGAHRNTSGVVVCSAIEHHAVLEPASMLGGRIVGVDRSGLVDVDRLVDALDDSVALVSIMLANNEVGVVQDLSRLIKIIREQAPKALIHTDAVQAFSWLDVSVETQGADLVSVSAHKFGGPKGVGVLVIREPARIAPLIVGGGQERERRSGTQNVAGIAGMAAAAEVTATQREATVERVSSMRDHLEASILSQVSVASRTVASSTRRVGGTAHLCFGDVDSEALLFLLEKDGVLASAGASCASGAMEPSHVLTAMGIDRTRAGGSLRLSLGYPTTPDEIDVAIDAIPPAVERLLRLDR